MSQDEIYQFLKKHPGKKMIGPQIREHITGCSGNTMNMNLTRLVKSSDVHRIKRKKKGWKHPLYHYWYEDI